jgi:hypothetical protein
MIFRISEKVHYPKYRQQWDTSQQQQQIKTYNHHTCLTRSRPLIQNMSLIVGFEAGRYPTKAEIDGIRYDISQQQQQN